MDLELIRRDFASFSDPTTPVVVTSNSISWTQSREDRTASLTFKNEDRPQVLFRGVTYDYLDFFASEHMADLRGLSEMLGLLLPKQAGFVGQDFVDPPLFLDDTSEAGAASALFSKTISGNEEIERTRLLFLKGRAGDGKSALLVETAYEQAKAYTLGRATSLYLYINAQGSALARIDEVIAKTLQDFRARFTYHAIATLTYLNLVVPIIDGFDELLGVGGYKDAFSSLALFISRLDGRGTVIASARSTFYQYTNFGEQASRFTTDENPLLFRIIPATLRPWGRAECEVFLKKRGISRPLAELESALGSRQDEILSSPFLFSQLVGLGPEVLSTASNKHVVRLIVEELVRREMQEKLLDPQGHPLLTLDQHIEFLGMLAEEMWWQEIREIDETTFTTLADMAAEHFGLAGDVATRFLNRIPSYALLTRMEGPLRIGFRHEFYFAFFLGTRIASYITTGEKLTSFFSRATMSTVIADEIAQTLMSQPSSSIPTLVTDLSVKPSESSAPDITRTNLGVMIWSLIQHFGNKLSGASINEAIFNGMDFSSTKISSVSFRCCIFNQCNLVAASWRDVDFQNCVLTGTVISEQTMIVGKGLRLRGDVMGLIFELPNHTQRQFYALSDVGAILERIGIKFAEKLPKEQVLSTRSKKLVRELEQFLHIAERTLYFSEDDFFVRGLSLEKDFVDIVHLLRKHGLFMEAAKKHRRGQRRMFRLSETPGAIRQGQAGLSSSKAIQGFWEDVLSLTSSP